MNRFSELKVEDYYVGGISQVSNGGVFLVSDSDFQDGLYKGYLFLASDFSLNKSYPGSPGLIEGFLPQSISEIGGKPYLIQSFKEMIFRIEEDSLLSYSKIDFGSKSIPDEAFKAEEAEALYEVLASGSYYFAAHNFLMNDTLTSFNYFNESIDQIELGLQLKEESFRFSNDSNLKELFLRPLATRNGLYHTVLLPDEYDEETVGLLPINEINFEKPILVSYTIGQ